MSRLSSMVYLWSITKHVLSQPHWKDHPLLRIVSNNQEPTVELIRASIENGTWKKELKIYQKQFLISNSK